MSTTRLDKAIELAARNEFVEASIAALEHTIDELSSYKMSKRQECLLHLLLVLEGTASLIRAELSKP